MLEKFKIGHYTDMENGTGVTVILAENGATAGCSVRGSAPATRETDLLRTEKTVQKINAVCLSGGSAFGLESADGVMQYLFERNFGYDAGAYRVPIVVGASVYDLEYKNFAFPDKKAGYKACLYAKKNNFESGTIGGATGATVSKIMGMDSAVKTALGVQTYALNGLEIAVISVVNALGDVVDNGKIIAGATDENGEFIDCARVMSAGLSRETNTNTTISCIITNAKLTKAQANVLADLAHDGYATTLSPSHTPYDGDAVFLMASGEKDCSFASLTAIIPELTAKAVKASVRGSEPIKKRVSPTVLGILKKLLK